MRFSYDDFGGNTGKRNNGNNGGNKKKNKQNQNNNNGKGSRREMNEKKSDTSPEILSSGMEFERGDGDRFFEEDEVVESVEKISMPEDVEKADEILTAFLEDYENVLNEHGNQVPVVIQDLFWDVSSVLTHYYENKYQSLIDKINKVFSIVSTQRFAASLKQVLMNEEVEGWNDGTTNIWKDVMFVISTALTTSHSMMKDETISLYIDLLASNGLAGKDISRLVKELGITKDLAVDLVASIPVIPEDITDATLRQFYPAFMAKVLEHASENIDVLDRTTQSNLFSFFFGKSKTALKALGRMLSHLDVTGFQNDSQRIIYAEYISMLSERLDAYEIRDIKYVLKFIVEEKKRVGKDKLLAWGRVSISDYSSIRKALLELVQENNDAKEFLINS